MSTDKPERATASDEDVPTVVVPCEDGPLLIRGDFAVRTQDGRPIEVRPGAVALCRCGRSRIRPFCDGTHKLVGFRAPSGPERPT